MHAAANKVLVKQDPPQDKIGLIHVPNGSERWPNYGTILSIGAGLENEEFRVGDRVAFRRRPHGKNGALDPDPRECQLPEYRDVLCLLPEDLLAILEP